jgi:hypothetical protein
MATANIQPFDRRQLKVNQVCIIVLLLAAYLVGAASRPAAEILTGVVLVSMLGGSLVPGMALFRQLYFRVLKPAGLVQPDVVQDDPTPHRFANGLGGVFVGLALLGLLAGATLAAWVLAWLVIALAALNFAFNICVGCIVFHQLERLHLIPGRAA